MDWDNDTDKDLIVGENNGNIRYYQNIGTASNPSLHYVGLMQAGGLTIDVGDYSTTFINDWNADGLPDLLAGESDGVINFFRNTGTLTNPVLGAGMLLNLAAGGNIDVGYRSAPVVADFNGDGLKDLISGEMNGKLYYYQNNGTNANPLLAAGVYVQTGSLQASTPGTSRPAIIDWNNDGHMDLVVGSYDARLKRFNWAATTPPAPTADVALVGSYLVPASGGTINYTVTVNNGTSSTVNFDGWAQLQMSNYTWMDLFSRPDLSLAPGGSLYKALSLYIPASWSAGYYYYHGYVGNYSTLQVYATDYFYFAKNYTGDGPIVEEFSFTPWEDESTPAVNLQVPQRPVISASPNPFNPTTTISFDLVEEGAVRISVYNMAGQQVAQLVNAGYPAGRHQVTWEASHLPAGVYVVALDAGHYHTAQKVTLIK